MSRATGVSWIVGVYVIGVTRVVAVNPFPLPSIAKAAVLSLATPVKQRRSSRSYSTRTQAALDLNNELSAEDKSGKVKPHPPPRLCGVWRVMGKWARG
ncbi:hypothetical protein E2C01_093059 [Portunus trituberculatus]|uniref:Uncharacterized protein n=1 Tax=Portunus trituberculatus TaxID=210409 RepID=A0A5B7JLU6_PORTR|nr:hypothetical protein [Portunus trituberculatus]